MQLELGKEREIYYLLITATRNDEWDKKQIGTETHQKTSAREKERTMGEIGGDSAIYQVLCTPTYMHRDYRRSWRNLHSNDEEK